SLEKKWLPLQPPAGKDPRMLFHYCANPLRSVRGSHKLLEVLWPKLKKIVVIDFRMSSTARHADYVLPAATWYETTDHKWVTPLMPYNHVTNAATKPLGDSKTDFWIFTMLAKHIQQRAKQRGIATIKSHLGKDVRLDRLYEDLTMDGRFLEDETDKAAGAILDASSNLSHVSWEEQKEKGFARYNGVGRSPMAIGNAGDLNEREPFVALTNHTDGKKPYPTATRRIQFYLDHDTYLAYDEALPRYKAPPLIGGDYPLMMTGGHPRWSIHAVWRDSISMLRLNRGGPYLIMGPEDAKDREIEDGDWIRAFNDVGKFVARVKISPTLMPGQTIMYHAWENYQFPSEQNPRRVTPSPINPVELAGGHPHLKVGFLEGQPGGFDRDTRIEVVRLSDEEAQAMAATA
ncbi:MAG: molybdopterin dinucleotide binding domain-containing protein, partial [Gammaproteobacteria bacterium]|nr:molybdopterin dinucleotide binding domain-containing protein [Gammaproteobacteria bacterium]